MADEKVTTYGIGPFRPKCLQFLATMEGFLLVLSVFSAFSGMFGTYTVSQITTIERHFSLKSERTGLLLTVGDVGFFTISLIMGHLMARLHRPRLLSACALVLALSNLCFVLPFILHMGDEPNTGGILNATSKSTGDVCRMGGATNRTCDEQERRRGEDSLAFGFMALGMYLAGGAATGLWTGGIAFVDDNAGNVHAPKYLGE